MQLLSKAIYAILVADTGITDITGSGNIWHCKIPQRTESGSDNPEEMSIYFFTYAIDPVGATKEGRAEIDEHKVRIMIVGRDDANMYQVAQYVRYALDRVTPGWYAGINIQGSEFLTAAFDPEGEYELEYQQWMLDFSFRVIDDDIRIPGMSIPGDDLVTVTANVLLRAKVTKDYADFATAANQITIDIFNLPAKAVVHLITGQPSVFFSGGTLTNYIISVGKADDLNKYIFEQSVFTNAPVPQAVMSGGSLESMIGPTMLTATARSVGATLDAATEGQIDFWIYYSILQ